MNRLFIPILMLISQLIWQDSFSDEKKTWKNELILQVLQDPSNDAERIYGKSFRVLSNYLLEFDVNRNENDVGYHFHYNELRKMAYMVFRKKERNLVITSVSRKKQKERKKERKCQAPLILDEN